MDWIDLAQDRDRWRALVKTVMNIRLHKMLKNSWVAERLADSQAGLSSMELYSIWQKDNLMHDILTVNTDYFSKQQ
jgi:hypothetical protein